MSSPVENNFFTSVFQKAKNSPKLHGHKRTPPNTPLTSSPIKASGRDILFLLKSIGFSNRKVTENNVFQAVVLKWLGGQVTNKMAPEGWNMQQGGNPSPWQFLYRMCLNNQIPQMHHPANHLRGGEGHRSRLSRSSRAFWEL